LCAAAADLTAETIDLPTALGLAAAENPTAAMAAEAARASLVDLTRARALALPTLEAGVSFDLHRGNLQSSQGIILDVARQSLYGGAGASAVGAGTVTVPGIRLAVQLADAWLEPAAARQRVAGRQLEAEATRNDILREAAVRYVDLVGAEATLSAIRESEADLDEVVRLTATFARAGQGREGDAERARDEALLLRVEEQHAEEELAVASAELARVLNRDPSVRLRGPAGPLPLIELVPAGTDVESLVQEAVRAHPEVAARTADVEAAATELHRERVRPLLPFLSVGFSAGGFGGGSDAADTRFGHFGGRTDFDVLAVWTLRNLGFGDLAEQRRGRARVGQAEAERVRAIDRVRREVAEAHARILASRQQLEIARQRVETARRGYRLDLSRSKNLEGRPIEVLNSFNLLHAARLDLIRAAVGYNEAQFQLLAALGRVPRIDAGLGPSCADVRTAASVSQSPPDSP
jgi:outer membrane protein TolC